MALSCRVSPSCDDCALSRVLLHQHWWLYHGAASPPAAARADDDEQCGRCSATMLHVVSLEFRLLHSGNAHWCCLVVHYQVYHEPGNPDAQVWAVPLQSGAAAVALFNAGEEPARITLDFGRLGCCCSSFQDATGHPHHHHSAVSVRDLLSHSELGTFSCCCCVDAPMPPAPGEVPAQHGHLEEGFGRTVAPHDVILLRLERG